MRARRSLVALGLLLLSVGASAWFAARHAADPPRTADVAPESEGAALLESLASSANQGGPPALATESDARRALPSAERALDSSADVVAVAEGPLLVAGRVVDELGAPIGGVALELDCLDTTRRKFAARSDDRGNFRLHGERPPFGANLRVTKSGFAPHAERIETFPVDAFEERVLVMRRGASLRGRLWLDEGIDLERIELVLATHRDGFRAKPTATGSFEFLDLPAGYAELGVQDHGRTLHWLTGLTLVAGEAADDPRLDPLDLRGRLRAWSLRLVHADGSSLAAKEVGVQWSTETLLGQWSERTDEAGRIAALLPIEVERVWLDVEGFQDPCVSPDVRECVVLPMPTVRFGVDTRALEFVGRVRFELTFLDASPPGGVAVSRVSLAENGSADVVLDFAGRYQVGWVPLALGSETLAWPAHVIDVRPEPSEQFFELSLDAAQLAALREAVGN